MMWWMVWAGLAQAQEYAPSVHQHGEHLKVALDPVADADEVAVRLRFEQGWDTETATTAGVTHLVEHLWFRSLDDNGTEVHAQLRAFQCDVDGFTTPEHMELVVSCPRSAATYLTDEVFRVLSDGMRGVDDDRVVVEQRIIDQELRERLTGRRALMTEVYQRVVPGMQGPIQRLLPDPEAVPRLSVDAVQARYRQLVDGPKVLSMSGAFDASTVRRRLSDGFGEATEVRLAVHEAPDQPSLPARSKWDATPVPAMVDASTLLLSYPLPAGSDETWLPKAVAGKVETLLVRELIARPVALALSDARHAPGGVDCWINNDDEVPLLACSMTLQDPADGRRVASLATEAIQGHFANWGVSQWTQELLQDRYRWTRWFEADLRSMPWRASYAMNAVAAGRRPLGPAELRAMLAHVEDRVGLVQMKELLKPRAASMVVFVPGPIPRATRSLAAANVPQMAPISIESSVPAWTPPTVVRRRLDTGLDMWVVLDPDATRAWAELRFDGGPGSVVRDVGREFERRLLFTPRVPGDASMGQYVTEHGDISVWMETPPDNLGKGLRALAGVVDMMEFASKDTPEEVQVRNIRRHLMHFSESAVYPDARDVLAEELRARLLPGHASSAPLDMDWLNKTFKLGDTTIDDYGASVLHPRNGVLVVVLPSSTDLDEAVPLAEKAFSRFKPGWTGLSWTDDVPPAMTDEAPLLWQAPSEPSDHVVFACRLPDGTSTHLANAFEGELYEQLWRHTRADAGWVYTPQAWVEHYDDGAIVAMATLSTAPRQAGELLGAARQAIMEGSAGPSSARTAQAALTRRTVALAGQEGGLLDLVFEMARDDQAKGLRTWHQRRLDDLTTPALQGLWDSCRAHQGWAVSGPRDR